MTVLRPMPVSRATSGEDEHVHRRTMVAASTLLCLLFISACAQAQTLGDVIKYAVNHYPAIAQAEANAAAAEAELAKAQAAYWPTVGVEAYGQNDYKRYRSDMTRPTLGVGPVAKIPIYTFGRIESEIDRQSALKDAADKKISSARDDTALAAAENYLAWARSLELLDLAKENLTGHQRIHDDTLKIVQSDPGRQFDQIQAATRLEGARLLFAQREAEVQQAAARLARYWPSPMPAVKSANPRGLDDFRGQMPKSSEAAYLDSEKSHPYLNALAAQITAAEAGISSAKAQTRPSISAQVSSLNNGTAQLVFNLPLFDRGATDGTVKAAIASAGAARMALDEGRLQIREKILISLVDFKTAEKRKQVSEDQAKKGRQLLTAYREQFLAGRRTLLDLLQTQNDYFGYRMTTTTGLFDIRLSRFRLMAAMGRIATAYEKN